jgi:hypothetical protein
MVAPGKPEYGAAQPQAGPPANELGCATAGLAIVGAIGGADGGIGKAMVGAIFDAIEGLAKAAGRNRGPHDEHLTPGIEPSNGDGHSSQRK